MGSGHQEKFGGDYPGTRVYKDPGCSGTAIFYILPSGNPRDGKNHYSLNHISSAVFRDFGLLFGGGVRIHGHVDRARKFGPREGAKLVLADPWLQDCWTDVAYLQGQYIEASGGIG